MSEYFNSSSRQSSSHSSSRNSVSQADYNIIAANHKFLWDDNEQKLDWKQQLAKKYHDKLKNKVDILIGVYHGGFENDIKSGRSLSTTSENIAYKIEFYLRTLFYIKYN